MIAKVVLLCATVAAIEGSHHVGLVNTGASISSRQEDGIGNYAFNYGIVDGLGATNSRAEVGDAHGNKKGSYSLTDIDGRARRVDYVADGLGFRAAVKTNEPGTALSAPAAAVVASPYAGPVAPVAVGHTVAAVAPVAAHASIAAPVYAGVPALVASKVVTTNVAGIASPLGYAAEPLGYAGVHGIAGPVGYAGVHRIAGPVGYAGVHGIAGHVGYAGVHGLDTQLTYAGHLGYGAGIAKAIY